VPLSSDTSSQYVRVFASFSQEVSGYQGVEQGIAHVGLKFPEALDLRPGELKVGHFEVFGLNEAKPVVDSALLVGHR